MSEEEQKYFKDLIGFTFDCDDIKYIEKIVDKKDKEIKELSETFQKIKTIINNEKITGIEAKLMIKDILEEK